MRHQAGQRRVETTVVDDGGVQATDERPHFRQGEHRFVVGIRDRPPAVVLAVAAYRMRRADA